jgi:hypothetical protein
LIKNKSNGYAAHLKKLLNAYALPNEDGLLDENYIFHNYYQIFTNIFAKNEL